MSKRELINEMGYEGSIVFDNPSYDEAIIGVSSNGNVIYDYDKMIECLMKEDGMTEEEAADFISYNTIRALDYITEEPKPVVMYALIE